MVSYLHKKRKVCIICFAEIAALSWVTRKIPAKSVIISVALA
jgi:hypothetical protein